MLTESTGAMKPVAVIIVGADALLAARPATPIQLWHACVAAGYDIAVPATWGDELIAAECLRILGGHPEPVAVMCTCPRVARAVADLPFDLSGNLVATVAPPVATAKYLRRVYGDRRVHITYAGGCPAAADSAIDAWITPDELLQRFRETEIVLEVQPELFESILPPDRRRHLSQPGGLPTADQVARLVRPRRVQEVDDPDLVEAIERHLSSAVRTLVDLAPRAGCACSGVSADVAAADARADVTKLEPPRSSRPVMADPGGLGLSRRLPVRQPVPSTEPAVRPQPPFTAPPIARPDRERAPVVATRAATLSPLSWHLRERAHPQPPTTARSEHRSPPARPDQRPTPESTRAVGASSSAWAAASAGRTQHAEPTPDPVTAAAVRALEQAAALRGGTGQRGRDEDRPGEAAPATSEEQARLAVESARLGAERPGSPDVERVSDEAPSREPEAVAGATSPTEPRPPRITPPGGYWFVAPIAAPGSDSEVRRPSAQLDAVPDDLGSSAVDAGPVEDHPDSHPVAEASLGDAAPEDPTLEEAPLEEAGLEGAGSEGATSKGAPPDGASPEGAPPEGVAPDEAMVADATLDEATPEMEFVEDVVRRDQPRPSSTDDDADAQPSAPSVDARQDSADPSANSAGEVREQSAPLPSTELTQRTSASGPLPWKWLVGATLLVIAAIAISRTINARVTTEESGMSALTSGTSAPGGLVDLDPLPAGQAEANGTRRVDSVPMEPTPTSAAPDRTRTRSRGVAPSAPSGNPPPSLAQAAIGDSAASDPSAAAIVARDSVRRDSARRVDGDTATPMILSVPRRDSAAPPPLAAREIELQSIRAELARRTARLDSMGRAVSSLYVAPRRPAPGVPSVPTPPPPSFRDRRD